MSLGSQETEKHDCKEDKALGLCPPEDPCWPRPLSYCTSLSHPRPPTPGQVHPAQHAGLPALGLTYMEVVSPQLPWQYARRTGSTELQPCTWMTCCW